MTEYAVMVKHPGFVDRFLRYDTPPDDVGGSIWTAIWDRHILRFKRRVSALQCLQKYQLHFAAKGETAYSFWLMKTVVKETWELA